MYLNVTSSLLQMELPQKLFKAMYVISYSHKFLKGKNKHPVDGSTNYRILSVHRLYLRTNLAVSLTVRFTAVSVYELVSSSFPLKFQFHLCY